VQKYIIGENSPKITLPEFMFFASLCKAQGLNPFTRECYIIKYSDKDPAQIVVSKDVFVERAIRHPQYDGKETGVIILKKDGKTEERQGCLVLSELGEKLVGGWARVYRKDKAHPEYMSVGFAEVAQHKGDGTLNKNWREKPATMVEKVAKARALREAFTDEMRGMVSEDEADVIDITPVTPALPEGSRQQLPSGAKKVNIEDV
jgi:phage recombination protein Bet